MPSASAAGGGSPLLPSKLEADRREYLAAVERATRGRPEEDPIRGWLSDQRARTLWDRYVALVYRQAARLAVVAGGDLERLYTRHLLDSLNPLSVFDLPPGSLLDVGSGGGFPGVPLGIAWPGTRVTLLESRDRKAGFLELVARELGLTNLTVVCARLEDRGAAWRESPPFDAVTIRAVGGLAALLKSLKGSCAPGATWIYFAGTEGRVEGLAASLRDAGSTFEAREGLFGGLLLVGRF